MRRWYVLYTKLHAERQVAGHLDRRGHPVYLPMIPVAWQRRDRARERPYFPGYLFVHYDLEADGKSGLIYTPGLRGIVSFGGEPAAVRDGDIAHIREYLATPRLWDKQGQELRRGDAVEILTEPFQTVDAVFDRQLSPAARVRVLLRYLEYSELERKRVERHIPLELDAQWVRKKDKHT